ncbi:MAG: family 43 glycosylhydrolase [Rikenellaceae bacterium]
MKHNSTITTILAFSAFLAVGCGAAPDKTASNQPPGYNPDALFVNSIAPDRGLADPHTLYVDGRLYAMCGHDRDWDIVDFCRMDRWEMWSTDNLVDWRYELSIDSSETYIGDEDQCWAGDLAVKDGTYYWYFSNKNYSTGVMSAPSITGPWKDALGEPLLPSGIIGKGHPYDPEIYEEGGVYSIIFGAGQYWIATLGDDMISLKDKPRQLMVYEADGVTRKGTGDKPCIFKRNDWFYLMWGEHYAMSRSLEGPYIYKGDFIHGGHGTVFQWRDGQWYSLQEQHETNAFYRGVQLRPIYFNEDDTVYIPEENWEYPLPGRDYDYTHSRMGWRCEGGGTEVEWVSGGKDITKGYITGKVDRKGAIITSVPFIHTPIHLCKEFTIDLDNRSGAKMLRMALYTYSKDLKPYTRKAPQQVDWSAEEWITIPLEKGVQRLTIPTDRFTNCGDYLHQIAIQPMADLDSGEWAIDHILLK